MSKSYRKTPIVPVAGASDKWDKRLSNRKFRKKEKTILRDFQQDSSILPEDLNEVSDVWGFAKDGKVYISEEEEKLSWCKKALRK
jgi:hypothetical protein